jgi:hypothetical protein
MSAEMSVDEDVPGAGIIRVSDVVTVVFSVVAVVSAVFLDHLNALVVAVSLVLFMAGCVAFLWAYAIAVGRSRTDAIGIGGLYFLQGSAPRSVQVRLLGALGVQVVVGVVTAAVHPFTSQAFAVLAPMFGLGLTGLWGARYGQFGPRSEAPEPVDQT